MRPVPVVLTTLGLAVFPSVLAPSFAATSDPPAELASAQPELALRESDEDDPERLRAARRAQAHELDFFAPYYAIEAGRDTVLFLMNTISDPISVTVSALAEGGAELALGSYVIESLQHVEISLRERLGGFEGSFATGSLRLSLLGDADTLQGWAVITEPDGQTFELPLVTPEEVTSRSSIAFWDTTIPAIPGAGGVSFHLLNTSKRVVQVQLTTGDGNRSETASFEVAPESRAHVEGVSRRPFAPRGWLELRHDGEAGDLVAVGVVGRARHSLPLRLVPLGEAATQERHESAPTSWGRSGKPLGTPPGDTWIALFNPGDERRSVRIEVIDAETGGHLGQAELDAGPKEPRSFSLQELLPAIGAASHPVRLRVRSEGGGVMVQSFTALSDGTLAEIAFFPYGVHPNGTYILPDPARYETITTVVNLGYQASRIAAQVYWNGGTYSIGPLEIPAGGSHRFDLDALAGAALPDLLGRELDPERPGGVLKWTLLRGSDRLLGRTEVRPRGHEDRFGFSCYGCCWQYPQAMIVPSFVEFTPGQERPFQVSETITDCAGTMGPYPVDPISLTTPQPFVWNGGRITSGTAADANLSFEMEELEVKPTCTSFLKRLFGFGRAEMCKATFNPRKYTTTKTCTQQTGSCFECKACCHNIAQEQTCQGKKQDDVTTNRNTCLGICFNDWEGNGC